MNFKVIDSWDSKLLCLRGSLLAMLALANSYFEVFVLKQNLESVRKNHKKLIATKSQKHKESQKIENQNSMYSESSSLSFLVVRPNFTTRNDNFDSRLAPQNRN